MSLKAIKLITFDATNTVLKFREPPWRFYTVVARGHGFTGSEELVRDRLISSYKLMWQQHPNFGSSNIGWEEWWVRVVKDTFEGHLPTNTNVHAMAVKLINDFKTSKCWTVAPSGVKLLCSLKNQNKIIGVISNFDPRLAEILHSVNIKDYFNFIVMSYQIGYSKPDKRIFEHALKQCGMIVKPSEALHIGDDFENDYKGARAAGWHALLLSEKSNLDKPVAPSHLYKNLDDLILAIENNILKL